MKRCTLRLLGRAMALAMLALSGALLSPLAVAQTVGRPIPPEALRATLVVTQPPDILINGFPDRLSPGARIRGTNNLLVLSGTLVGQQLPVSYLREPSGQVHEVWILTPAEAQKPPAAKP